jgi:hypothetical protein
VNACRANAEVDEMLRALFLDQSSRKVMRLECEKRSSQEWVRSLKRHAKESGWSRLSISDMFAIREMTMARTHTVAVLDAQDECVEWEIGSLKKLLARAWEQFRTSMLWDESPPDITTFLLGYISLCKRGKSHKNILVVPCVDFVEKNMPAATLLSKLDGKNTPRLRNNRQSKFAKKRIIDGQNIILATIQYEAAAQNLTRLVLSYPSKPTRVKNICIGAICYGFGVKPGVGESVAKPQSHCTL